MNIKKCISLVALTLVLLTLLTACGNLKKPKNGTYTCGGGWSSQTITLSNKNDITISGGLVSLSGTYKISGSTLSITSTMFGVSTTIDYTITGITSKEFYIDGEKYTKQ